MYSNAACVYGALCALCVVSGGPICKDVGQASPCTRSCLVVAAPPHPSHCIPVLTMRHAHATSTTPIHTGETKDHFVNLCHQDSEKVNGPRKRRTGSHAHRKLGACEVPPPILDRAEASVNLFSTTLSLLPFLVIYYYEVFLFCGAPCMHVPL